MKCTECKPVQPCSLHKSFICTTCETSLSCTLLFVEHYTVDAFLSRVPSVSKWPLNIKCPSWSVHTHTSLQTSGDLLSVQNREISAVKSTFLWSLQIVKLLSHKYLYYSYVVSSLKTTISFVITCKCFYHKIHQLILHNLCTHISSHSKIMHDWI